MSAPAPQNMPPQPSRFQEVMGGIPLGTMVVTGLCVVLHIMVMLSGLDIGFVAINAGSVLYSLQFYRLITAPYFHMGILHILMNMLSFVSIGGWLESKCGTLYLTFTILWATLLSNLIYITACWLLAIYITGDYSWLSYTSVGFSGVIFTLAFIESHQSTVASHSVMGFFNVPSKLYPWVLLILIQVMMPGISFLGHLSGLLVGVLQCYGLLDLLIPSAVLLRSIEQSAVVSLVARSSKFIPCPDHLDLDTGTDNRSAFTYLFQVLFFFVQGVWYVIQAIFQGLRSLCFCGGSSSSSSSLPSSPGMGHVRLPSDPVLDQRHAEEVRRFDLENPQQRLVL